mgnify:CR=1 FL=1
MKLFKKGIAEFVGTFVLVFFACGVAALTGGDLVPTALAFGLVIVAMAYTIGRVSGCHINPAVSLACLLDKRMTLKEFFVYIAGQLLGGFVGAILLFGIAKMSGLPLEGDACNNVVGGYANGFTTGNIFGSLLTEIVLTLVFVFVILAVTDGNEGTGKKAGLIIGLTLTLVHLVGIKLTGTSVNPARSFATALGALMFNGTTAALEQVWIFIVAPLIGGAIAVPLYRLFFSKKEQA